MSSLFSIAGIKHHKQNQLGKGRVYLSLQLQSIAEEIQGRSWRQEPRGRNWNKAWRNTANWLAPHCSAYLLIAPSNCWEVAPPTVDWTLPHQSLFKKMCYRLSRGIFSTDVSSSQMTVARAKLTRNSPAPDMVEHAFSLSNQETKKVRALSSGQPWPSETDSKSQTKPTYTLTPIKHKATNQHGLHRITGPLIKEVKRLWDENQEKPWQLAGRMLQLQEFEKQHISWLSFWQSSSDSFNSYSAITHIRWPCLPLCKGI